MHILVTNDDGPPSPSSSPYVLNLVRTLQSRGHTVSVCLPHMQRSWIGKAHMVGQIIKPSYYRPPPAPAPAASVPDHHADADADTDNDGTTAPKPLAGSSHREEWLLVDSTPASCVQIGLYHAFKSRGPIELVVSGPNYGRNTTAVFALSSGTLGAALEAAVCGVRAVALSYAFFAPGHDDAVIAACGRAAVRVVEGLVGNWDGDVGLYSVNVPVVADVERAKVLWTRVLQNRWTGGSCFKEIEVPEEEDRGPEEEEARIREEEGEGERQSSLTRRKATGTVGEDDVEDSGKQTLNGHVRYTHKHFKWAPRFKDVYESVEQAAPGNDGWAIKEGHISVTPLKANFMHLDGHEGEVEFLTRS